MEQDELTSGQNKVEQALLSVIEHQKIDLLYQGQYRLPSKQLVGLEALCRIPAGSWGNVLPEQFIPVAEEIGLIAQLERIVFKQISHDLPQLLHHHPDIRISINLSIRHITAPDFSSFIHGWLDTLPKFSIRCLDFEITETYGANVTYLEAPMLELSATLIRNNRKNGITIRYLVPDKVKDEIENNNYFKNL